MIRTKYAMSVYLGNLKTERDIESRDGLTLGRTIIIQVRLDKTARASSKFCLIVDVRLNIKSHVQYTKLN